MTDVPYNAFVLDMIVGVIGGIVIGYQIAKLIYKQ